MTHFELADEHQADLMGKTATLLVEMPDDLAPIQHGQHQLNQSSATIQDALAVGVVAEISAPPMMQPLDQVLEMFDCDKVQDLQVVTREFADGSGKFEAVHNSQLSRSLMTGSFNSVSQSGTTSYEGTFLNDPHSEFPAPSGQGVRRNADGSVYSGQWKDGHPDGHGEWTAPEPSCESFLGEWKRGKKHGFGMQKFVNGDSYEGDWANGKFQDRGKYKYANGDEFIGVWDNGLKRNGTFYFADGRVSTRRFDNGRLVACQDYDANRRHYQPTITKEQVHDAGASKFGARRPPPGA